MNETPVVTFSLMYLFTLCAWCIALFWIPLIWTILLLAT